jgi:serine phosphatase RsbU (regulator of sigma subunit)
MAFWKKKPTAGGEKTAAKAPAVQPNTSEAKTETEFISGDAIKDRRTVEVLLDAVAQVSESRDLEQLLLYVVDRSVELTGAERGFLLLQADGKQEVRVARERGGVDVAGDAKYSTSVVGQVFTTEEPVRTTVQTDAEALELGASVFDLKLRAVMCVPFSNPGAGINTSVLRGALYVDSKAATRAFTDEDLSLFHALAKHIAIALDNARLHIESLEKVKLERSLEIASEIQGGLMPSTPKTIPGFDVHGWYRSAEHASGDFYDFVKNKGGRLAVVVGDVTGHGIGPALITATAQASLRSYVKVLDDPAAIVTMLNQDLAERMDDGMFLTLFVALISSDGLVQVVNAGATPPLVWRDATNTIERIDGNGPALGMMDEFEYSLAPSIQLEKGDAIIAFTDGLVEARHESRPDRLFDEAGMRAVIAEWGPSGASSRELTEQLVAQVMEFTGGYREDDMTLVAVRREPDA